MGRKLKLRRYSLKMGKFSCISVCTKDNGDVVIMGIWLSLISGIVAGFVVAR